MNVHFLVWLLLYAMLGASLVLVMFRTPNRLARVALGTLFGVMVVGFIFLLLLSTGLLTLKQLFEG